MSEPQQIVLVVRETGAAAQQAFAYHIAVNGELVAAPSALSPEQSQMVRSIAQNFNSLFELRRAPQLAVGEQQTIGKALFDTWLGAVWPAIEAKLRAGPRMLVIASPSAAILNLPWELLRLPNGNLAGCDLNFPIRRLPVRDEQQAGLPAGNVELPARPLRVLFQACAPIDQATLNYETEEALLLAAVGQSASVDSGDLGSFEELRDRINRFGPHVVHLTGHGVVTKRCPACGKIARQPHDERCWNCDADLREVRQEGFFAFEDERGETDLRSAGEIAGELFAGSNVQAAFISGCQSGKAPPIAAVGGLCAGLVDSGLPLAIGWAASIEDTLASAFAETFYNALAKGVPFDRAAIQARQAVRKTCDQRGDPSWALPLVYAASTQAQVFDTNTRRAAEPAPTVFDGQKSLEGMSEGHATNFVGRRREIQRRLPDLREGKLHTLVITGMGGAGKSTLATRLARKLEVDGWTPIAAPSREDQPLNAALLIERCGDAFRAAARDLTSSDPQLANFLQQTDAAIAEPQLPLDQRLRDIVGALKRVPFVLVLDNFETNMDPESRVIVDPTIARFYRYLLENLIGESRAIVTSRYLPAGAPLPPRLAAEEPLSDFPYGSFLKLLLADGEVERRYRTGELPGQLLRDLHRNLGGAPRFLDQLGALLRTIDIGELTRALQTLAAPSGQDENKLRAAIDSYCETLIVPRLFGGLSPDQQAALCRAAVLGIAAPPDGLATIAGIAPEALQPMLASWQQRAFAYPDAERGGLWAIYGTLRPWLLAHLPEDERKAAHKRAGDYLREIVDQKQNEELGLNWIDCLLEARAQYLAAGMFEDARKITGRISGNYLRRGLYPEVERLNREMLGFEEHHETQNWIGRTFLDRGDYKQARQHYLDAGKLAEQIGDRAGEAATLHNLATIDVNEGNYPAARERFSQALQISQQIGDRAGEAATLHNLASIDVNEGNYPAARERFSQSLTIKQQIGDRAGEAATLHQLASIDVNEGNYPAARERFSQALQMLQQIGDRAGEAATLHNLATIDVREGNYPAARERFSQALQMRQQIGDRYGEAATFYQLGSLAVKLQHPEQGASLVALCFLIDQAIGHGDTQSDFKALSSIASQLNYTQEQFNALLQRAAEGYQADRGWGLVRAAFPETDG